MQNETDQLKTNQIKIFFYQKLGYIIVDHPMKAAIRKLWKYSFPIWIQAYIRRQTGTWN